MDKLIMIGFLAILIIIITVVCKVNNIETINVFKDIKDVFVTPQKTQINKTDSDSVMNREDVECVNPNASNVSKHLEYAMGEFVDTGLSRVYLVDYSVVEEEGKYRHTFSLAIENTGVKSGIVLRENMFNSSVSSPRILVGVGSKGYVKEVKIDSKFSNLVIPHGSTYIIDCKAIIPENNIDYIGYEFSSKISGDTVRISPHYKMREPEKVNNVHTSQYNDLELYQCGDTVKTNKANIVVKSRYYSRGREEYGIVPRDGRVISNVTIDITNTSDKGYNTVGEFEFYLVNEDGVTFRDSNQYNVINCVSNNDEYLMPGETKEYVVMFESDVSDHRLIIKDSEDHRFETTNRQFLNDSYSVQLNKASIN